MMPGAFGIAGGTKYCFYLRSDPPPADLYEPNDTVAEATPLSLPFSARKLFLAEERTDPYSGGAYNADWFTFSLGSRSLLSATLTISLYAGHQQNVSATLIGPNGFSQVFTSGWDGVLEPGTYYLKVAGTYGNSTTDFGKTYGLSLSASPVP